MKLELRDKSTWPEVRRAFEDRGLFVLTGAGVRAEYVGRELTFDYPSEHLTLELVQVTSSKFEPAEPEPWNGGGLPPVGTVCEWLMDKKWKRAEIVYLSQHTVLAKLLDGMDGKDPEFALDPEDAEFRPIRTSEQIKAEEREAAVADLFETMTGHRDQVTWANTGYPKMAEILYDAGYRKVDQ